MRLQLLVLPLLLTTACVTAEGNGIPHAGPSQKEAYSTGGDTAKAASEQVEASREADRTGLIYASSAEGSGDDPDATPPPAPEGDLSDQAPPPMRERPEDIFFGLLASEDSRVSAPEQLSTTFEDARKEDEPVHAQETDHPDQAPPPMRVRPEGIILGLGPEETTLGLKGDGPLASEDARVIAIEELGAIIEGARKGDEPVQVVIFVEDGVTEQRRADLVAALKKAGADQVSVVGPPPSPDAEAPPAPRGARPADADAPETPAPSP